MSIEDILIMLKANLEITNTIKDDYLRQLMSVSMTEIKREGIIFSETEQTDEEGHTFVTYPDDEASLIVMYAAYLYRKRATNEKQYDTAAFGMNGMPRMLRYALNQKLMSQKMRALS